MTMVERVTCDPWWQGNSGHGENLQMDAVTFDEQIQEGHCNQNSGSDLSMMVAVVVAVESSVASTVADVLAIIEIVALVTSCVQGPQIFQEWDYLKNRY